MAPILVCDIMCVPRYEAAAIHYVSAARNPGALFMPDVMGTARTERVDRGEEDGTLHYLPNLQGEHLQDWQGPYDGLVG